MKRAGIALALLLFLRAGHAFVLEDNEHRVHRLADYKGRWVLVNFWATWCAPCLEEIPELVALAEQRRDIQVIGVAIDWQDARQVLQFAEGMYISYPIVLGDRELAKQLGNVSRLPTSFIYALDGTLVARHAGTLTRKQVIRLIDRAR